MVGILHLLVVLIETQQTLPVRRNTVKCIKINIYFMMSEGKGNKWTVRNTKNRLQGLHPRTRQSRPIEAANRPRSSSRTIYSSVAIPYRHSNHIWSIQFNSIQFNSIQFNSIQVWIIIILTIFAVYNNSFSQLISQIFARNFVKCDFVKIDRPFGKNFAQNFAIGHITIICGKICEKLTVGHCK